MPEQEPGEELDNLTSELKAGENSIVAEEQGGENLKSEEAGSQTEKPDYAEMESEKLAEVLAERDKALEEAQKSLKESQSLRDRQYNAQATEMAELKGALNVLQSQATRGSDEPTAEEIAAQEKFDEDLIKTLNADPGQALPMLREMIREAKADNYEKLSQELEKRDSRIDDLNPVYKANKDKIDALMEKHDIADRNRAIAIFQDFNGGKEKQPGVTPAPGTTKEGSAGLDTKKPEPRAIELDGANLEILKLTGRDPKAIKRITRAVAKDLAV